MLPKFIVGDIVRIKGTSQPRRVMELWRGKRHRYLLGVELDHPENKPPRYQVERKLVEEDKLERVEEVAA